MAPQNRPPLSDPKNVFFCTIVCARWAQCTRTLLKILPSIFLNTLRRILTCDENIEYVRVYVYMYIHVHVYVFIYIYIYMCMYMYICIYIYIYIYRSALRKSTLQRAHVSLYSDLKVLYYFEFHKLQEHPFRLIEIP